MADAVLTGVRRSVALVAALGLLNGPAAAEDMPALGVWGGLVIGLGFAAVLLNLRFWRVSLPGVAHQP